MKTNQTFSVIIALLISGAAVAQTVKDSTSTITIKTHRTAKRVTRDFGLYIGLNNWNGSAPSAYDLRTGGSRFVALSWRRNILLAQGEHAKLRLGIGPEVAWNNFMFEDNNALTERNNVLVVEPSTQSLRKSKLVVAQLNVPALLSVKWSSGISLGAGAYIGTRIGSYTSVKPESSDRVRYKADRDHGSYNLNPVRWGMTAEFGWAKDDALFFRYEPSPLFRDGQGPKLNVWNVGLRL